MKKEVSIFRNLLRVFLFPASVVLALIVEAVIFATLYVNYSNVVFLIFLASFSFALLCVLGYAIYFSINYVHKNYYKGIVKTTKSNLEVLAKNDGEISLYPDIEVKEFKDINQELKKVKTCFENSLLMPNKIDYSKFSFEYIDGLNEVINFTSFKDNIENLIYFSSNFRNLFLYVYYEMDEGNLENSDIKRISELLSSTFKSYGNTLLALDDDKKGIYIYLPHIDSISKIEEEINGFIQNITISKQTTDGMITIGAKVVGVVYPYSDVDEIMHDIRYAKNQNKDVYFYLPNRIINKHKEIVDKNTMHLNIVSKILRTVDELNKDEQSEYLKTIRESLRDLMTFVNANYAGLIQFDENKSSFYSTISIASSSEVLFEEEKPVNAKLLNNMNSIKDLDNSYFFAKRSHANAKLGRNLDVYHISAGFYYIIMVDGNMKGVIYFFNKDNELDIDSYVREGLTLYANKISNFLTNVFRQGEVSRREDDVDNLLKLTNFYTYRVNRVTNEIKSFSRNMKDLVPSIEVGKTCYKVLYGLEKPCQGCPLLTSRKMQSGINNAPFETSLNLMNDAKSIYGRLLLKKMAEKDVMADKYNKDLLCFSYVSLIEELNNCYAEAGKGYLLLLRFDNLDDLVSKYGSENLLLAERNFIKEIKRSNSGLQNVYMFSNQCIGLLFKELGQIDIVTKCENIYEISQMNYFGEGSQDVFNITYLPMNYPSGYPKAIDFLKYSQRFIQSNESVKTTNSIFFPENGYTRSASKKEYMLSVIEDKFTNQTFIASLQPYLQAKYRRVYGVEMLLRLVDDYSNTTFNTDELIKVAANNGKIKVISDALITFAGNLYQKQGASIFKVFGLERFSINVDYSYFADENNLNSLVDLIESYNLPRGFIAFEITENEIKQYLEEFKHVSHVLAREHISLICDQYSGKFLPLEKLKEAGFNEVKIGRGLVGSIDGDPQKYAQFADIVNNAKALNMQVSTVGVENNEQYQLIRELDENAYVQGFYFYKPLDKNDLINALRNSNVGHTE